MVHILSWGDGMKRLFCCLLMMAGLLFPANAEDFSLTLMPPEEADGFSMEVLSVKETRKEYRVFIYHTHTYESYDPSDGNTYQSTEQWRTADPDYNMIRVGEEMKKMLESAGIYVTHDTTAYEPPKLSTAYGRSLEGVKAAAVQGYDLYIDLHRDAYSAGNGPNTMEMDGKKAARVLFLIGQGASFDGAEKPEWEKNHRAAKWISDEMNAELSGISRGVSLKSGRYNQHAATPCILIEMGNNQNTLTEVLETVPCLCRGICSFFDNMDLQETPEDDIL